MSFPNVIYGDYGDEKRAQSTKIGSLPLGTLMILPDGRKFRHAVASTAAALTAGYVQQGAGVPADTRLVTNLPLAATVAVGAISVAMTAGGTTAIVTNIYADGYLMVGASTSHPGAGRIYKIISNNSAAAGSTLQWTANLDPADPIETALPAGTTTVGVRTNEYFGLLVVSGDSALVGPVAGVAPVAVSAGFYHWIQRSGQAAVFNAGTILVVGDPVVCSSGVAGAVAQQGATTITAPKQRLGKIGYGMSLGVADGFAVVNLTLD